MKPEAVVGVLRSDVSESAGPGLVCLRAARVVDVHTHRVFVAASTLVVHLKIQLEPLTFNSNSVIDTLITSIAVLF